MSKYESRVVMLMVALILGAIVYARSPDRVRESAERQAEWAETCDPEESLNCRFAKSWKEGKD